MNDDYQIHINFLPIMEELPAYTLYRRVRLEGDVRPSADTSCYSFAVANDPNTRKRYWVKWTLEDSFEEFVAHPADNNDLTKSAIFKALIESAQATREQGSYYRSKGFIDELSFIMREHAEGQELLRLQPYLLRQRNIFGFLASYHFHKFDSCPFSRRVQQLSLSLDRHFKRNIDFYLDWHSKVSTFLREISATLNSLRLPGAATSCKLASDFTPLPARRMRSKIYVFGNGRESKSQFSGLRDYGPLQPLSQTPQLLFLFREQDRPAARILAAALKGSRSKEKYSFPGFQSLFKSELAISSQPIVLPDLSSDSMSQALSDVKARRSQDSSLLPIMILPEGNDNGYLVHKAGFAHAGIPTQVCTLPVILDDNALKWAIANVALQVFCKAGGLPWKVRPSTESTLIVGISQSHKLKEVDGRTEVDKYFAFTVMTDNSGLFQNIQVLGEAANETDYLSQMRANLRNILSQESTRFSRVVIHTSFKLRNNEIDAVQEIVTEAAQSGQGNCCRFAVVKVNHKCRFFGENRNVNSLVPYEGTVVYLGKNEYVAWFEGVFPEKPTVNRRFAGPTHLEIMRTSENVTLSDGELLQDLVNLSGANWRGFNAKSAPVSVFYCHLVADVVHNFHEMGLPLPEVQVFRPWFL